MLEGFEPWGIASDALGQQVDKNHLKHIRSVGDEIIDDMHLTKEQKGIQAKMIALDYDERYRSVNDVIKDLTRGTVAEPSKESLAHTEHCEDGCVESVVEKNLNAEEIRPRIGGGFADVAGMESVKSMLYKDVMFVMQNKEKAAKYRLKAPNGSLFYGPPGCGKNLW